MSFIIKTHASHATDVLIKDLGFYIPASGGSVTLTTEEEITNAALSEDLAAYLIDIVYSPLSTLCLNDGTDDILGADALKFMQTYLLPNGADAFGVVKSNADGEIDQSLTMAAGETISGITLGDDMNANGNTVTGLTAGSDPTDAVTKAQLDAVSASSKVWKELVIDADQLLDGSSGGVRSAIAWFIQEQPAVNNILVIKRSTPTAVTETYTFKAAEAVAFDVAIGADVDETIENTVQAIIDDSAVWDAKLATTLTSINDGTGSVAAGLVAIIFESAALNTGNSRIYGTFTAAVPKYVDFNGESDYEKSAIDDLPAADPAERQFGFGRAFADLVTNETHTVRTTDTCYTWDADADEWQNTGANGVQAGYMLTKTGDVIDVIAGADGNVQALGNAATNGTLEAAARVDHVHTHGNRGGDTPASQHDADQVDVEGAYSRIGGADTVEAMMSDINANFGAGQYVGKVFSYSQTVKVPVAGTLFLKSAGGVVSSATGKRMIRAGAVSALALQVDAVDASRAYKLSVEKSTDGGGTWTEIASMALGTSTLGAVTTAPTGTKTYAAGNLLRVSAVLTSGSGSSTFTDMDATVETNEG